jgi:hypothetical protein
VNRREVIAGLGAAAWPLAARGQQGEHVRRIGVLMEPPEGDAEGKAHLSGFTQALGELGWIEGRNLRIDVRWAAGSIERIRMFAKELVDLQPDVILSRGTPATAAFQRETRTIPIVFVAVGDPVGSGFVAGLPRPGGNITGFGDAEQAIAGKCSNCSWRSRPASSGSQSCSIPTWHPAAGRITSPHPRQLPDHAKWSRSQRRFITMPKSNRPWPRWGASRAAGWS